MFALNRNSSDASRPGNQTQKTADNNGGRTNAVEVKLTSPQSSYRYGDKVPLTATIRNSTDSPVSYTFNSACTQGKLSIDGQPTQVAQSCADAITEVSIEPGSKKEHAFDFVLVRQFSPEVRSLLDGDYLEIEGELKLPPGRHTASLRWQDMTSNSVTFDVVE